MTDRSRLHNLSQQLRQTLLTCGCHAGVCPAPRSTSHAAAQPCCASKLPHCHRPLQCQMCAPTATACLLCWWLPPASRFRLNRCLRHICCTHALMPVSGCSCARVLPLAHAVSAWPCCLAGMVSDELLEARAADLLFVHACMHACTHQAQPQCLDSQIWVMLAAANSLVIYLWMHQHSAAGCPEV